MIRVLIVEDSITATQLLTHILSADPELQVAGSVPDGLSALQWLEREQVDVVTMDVNLPGMNGFEATRRIMETRPHPIVIVTSLVGSPRGPSNPFHVMDEGALALLPKPPGTGHPGHEAAAAELVRTVKLAAGVKVFRRGGTTPPPGSVPETPLHDVRSGSSPGRRRMVVIGSSTGGTLVVEQLIRELGPRYGLPVLLVQHIATGFTKSFSEWLQHSTGVQVRIAQPGERPASGVVYLPPDDQHLGLAPPGLLQLSSAPPLHGARPSVSYLFASAARTLGSEVVGVLLSGMGHDGAEELGLLRRCGALTVVQAPDSCVVAGMPGEAVRLGAAVEVLEPLQIATRLASLKGSSYNS